MWLSAIRTASRRSYLKRACSGPIVPIVLTGFKLVWVPLHLVHACNIFGILAGTPTFEPKALGLVHERFQSRIAGGISEWLPSAPRNTVFSTRPLHGHLNNTEVLRIPVPNYCCSLFLKRSGSLLSGISALWGFQTWASPTPALYPLQQTQKPPQPPLEGQPNP